MEKVNAIILAGTGYKKRLIDEHDGLGIKNKGLVTVYKKPLVVYVLQRLQNSDYIDQNKVGIVGPKEKLEKIIGSNVNIINEEKTLFKNARKAYDKLSPNGERTLFIACDLPFVNTNTMDNFIKQCNNHLDKRFYFQAINTKNIPKEIEPFKKTKKFHLKERGYYRTANMALFEGAGIKDRGAFENQARDVSEARRITSFLAFLRLMWAAGRFTPEIFKHYSPGGFLRTRGLTQEEVETAIEKKVHIPFKLIETTDWRAAADIDYQTDFEFFKRNYEDIIKRYS